LIEVLLRDSQKTPSVGVEDRSDYLRSGNVKLDDQSLGLFDSLPQNRWPVKNIYKRRIVDVNECNFFRRTRRHNSAKETTVDHKKPLFSATYI
jgi:hypothetical protein